MIEEGFEISQYEIGFLNSKIFLEFCLSAF